MATATAGTEEVIAAAGVQMHVVKGGSGSPVVILHDEMGHPGWLPFHDALAQTHTVNLPLHPGFGTTERVEWVMTMRDMAGWYLEAFDDLGYDQIPLVGYGLGGWLAAEMATMCPQQFSKLVIASAPGVRPPSGQIFDMFLVVAKNYLTEGIYDPDNTATYQELYAGDISPELAEAWDYAREEASRLTWRPYMHYPNLPPLLHRLKRLPTLVIWGREDAIVPLSAGEAYHAAIPGSQLVVLDRCGHHPHIEQPDTFVKHIQDFLG